MVMLQPFRGVLLISDKCAYAASHRGHRELPRQQGLRRAAHRRDLPQLRRDKTGNFHLPHVVDPATGRYRDRQVLTIETPAA